MRKRKPKGPTQGTSLETHNFYECLSNEDDSEEMTKTKITKKKKDENLSRDKVAKNVPLKDDIVKESEKLRKRAQRASQSEEAKEITRERDRERKRVAKKTQSLPKKCSKKELNKEAVSKFRKSQSLEESNKCKKH